MGKQYFFSKETLKSGSPWIFLFLGIIAYTVGYFLLDSASVWKEIIIKVADVFVIGVVIGYLSNAAQFLGIFKKDLQDIIYAKDFVSRRKDLPELWDRISKEMFKNKFSSIHNDFLQVMKGYFPTDEVTYYDDFNVYTTIYWVNKDEGIIKVEDIITFDLRSESKNKFIYPMKSWLSASDDNAPKSKISDITVNGEPASHVDTPEPYTDRRNGYTCQEFNVTLQGSTCYSVKYKREQEYDINDDYYIGFQSLYIVNNMKVCLNLPEDIDAMFIGRGTQHGFDTVNKSKNRIEMRYKGIVLPKQGYIFALQTL